MRQVVLDTETTGLETEEGHRILEIGCVEIIDRRINGRHFHQYINPERDIDDGALEVHGITRESLADQPRFANIWPDFLEFVRDAELIIHNAAFDVGFINYEMSLMNDDAGVITSHCTIIDSLKIAREKYPGQKNSLDALCKRFSVDNSQRTLHGALLDAEILADVYLLLTGGQADLMLDANAGEKSEQGLHNERQLNADRPPLRVVKANDQELELHNRKLDEIEQQSGQLSMWRKSESTEPEQA
jgi:DNA polymerase-3 subunit epsilon